MTKRTVTDFETVRVEEEQWECDHCEALVDEDEIHTAVYLSGDQIPDDASVVEHDRSYFNSDLVEHDGSVVGYDDVTHRESKHLCEDCLQLREANQIRETKQYYRSWWRGTRKHLAWLTITIVPFLLGLSADMIAPLTRFDGIFTQHVGGMMTAVMFAIAGGIATVVLLIAIPDRSDEN